MLTPEGTFGRMQNQQGIVDEKIKLNVVGTSELSQRLGRTFEGLDKYVLKKPFYASVAKITEESGPDQQIPKRASKPNQVGFASQYGAKVLESSFQYDNHLQTARTSRPDFVIKKSSSVRKSSDKFPSKPTSPPPLGPLASYMQKAKSPSLFNTAHHDKSVFSSGLAAGFNDSVSSKFSKHKASAPKIEFNKNIQFTDLLAHQPSTKPHGGHIDDNSFMNDILQGATSGSGPESVLRERDSLDRTAGDISIQKDYLKKDSKLLHKANKSKLFTRNSLLKTFRSSNKVTEFEKAILQNDQLFKSAIKAPKLSQLKF
jgi:hypothetical protein